MFKYKAQESMVSAPGEVDDKKYDKDMSAGAVLMVGEDVVHGIMTSVAEILVARGKPIDEVEAKIKEFANAMKANNDISKDSYAWVTDSVNIGRLHHYYDYDTLSEASNSNENLDVKYDAWWTLKDSVTRGCSCVLKWGVDRSKYTLNEREKSLLDELDEISEKYYDIKSKVREYFRDIATDHLYHVITKYSDILSKIDEEWFKAISEGVNRDWNSLQKKIAEKKAESSSALTRALPSEPAK